MYKRQPHIPAGLVTSDQLRKLADVADKYNVSAIKITAAQRIALVGLKEDDIDSAWNDLGMKPGAAIGLCVRSIKTCPGTSFCKRGFRDSVDVYKRQVINHPIQSPYVMSQFGETRIVTTHGYTDSKEDTINKAKSMGADILILGHTHVKELYLDENLVVLNPGSTSIPKDGTHSVAIIDIIQSEDEIDMNFNLIDINTKNIINLD